MNCMLVISLVCLVWIGSTSAGGKRLQLKVIKHQPCTTRSTPSERIRFSPISKAPLINDEDRGDGCYAISGPVQVRKGIHGTVQVYVEAKSGSKSNPEKCTGADSKNCGGVGSCVYCDLCQSIEQVKKTTSNSVQITQAGKQLDCENGVNAGNYSDIRISWCMPTKEEFLKAEGIGEDIWNQNNDGGHMFFMTIYVFNKAVNTLSNEELQKIATDDNDQVIGCHRMVCTLYDPSD